MEIRAKNIGCFKIWMKSLLLLVFCLTGVASVSPAYAAEPLLIIRVEGRAFDQAVKGLSDELEEDFAIVEMVVGRETTVSDIKMKVDVVSPKIVVLMDNQSISLFKQYQGQLPDSQFHVPSVSIMGVFLDIAIDGLSNAAGIYYEVPVVTSIVNLRSVLNMRFDKVGLVYRPFIGQFVQENTEYCAKEGVELVAHEISLKSNVKKELKRGLKALRKKVKVDAIWVPNDSLLVNNVLLQEVWLPFANRYKKPIIVGVEILVDPLFNFGTFAVIPDHTALGMQAAEMVFDAMENNWRLESNKVEPPRSVYKIINLKQARRLFSVNEEGLANIDKISE